MVTHEVYRKCGVFTAQIALAVVLAAILALALSATARAATIMVDSLADTGAPGICVLRDAITAANTMTATNGCAAGTGNDTIQFSVTGTITIASTLPLVTDSVLTINGPAAPGIIISGGGNVQVMQVGFGVTLNLDELTIANGKAAIGVNGGGIGNEGTLSVSNSTFSDNLSINGGAIYNAGKLVVTNSTFDHNTAFDGFGGAINNSFMASVINSTFHANVSFQGGGIYNAPPRIGGNPVVAVTNSTFEDNVASGGDGAGIFNSAVSGEATVKGTIIAGSTGVDCFGKLFDFGYNIADDLTCEFQKTGSAGNGSGVNPLLSQAGLANNGGPTQTIALLGGSPAIDAIPLADCTDQALPPNPIITDQRGFPRPDGTESLCDIGAYEVQDLGSAFVPFSSFRGHLTIHPNAGVFYLSGGFKLGARGSIDPTTQLVTFSVGSYAVRLPAGSFTKYSTGYVYQKKVNGIFLCIFIKFTSTPDRYVLLANRNGGRLTSTISPVPVTLTIGDDGGSTQMNAKFD